MSFLYVALGAFFGSILRYYISEKTHKHLIGTWIANITGSILLAILLRLHINEAINDAIWLVLGVGFCGSYTTFSTFSNEMLQLLIKGKYTSAITYILSTISISILFVVIVLYLNTP